VVTHQNKILTEQELKEIEKKNIMLALVKAGGKISGKGGAAELLQIPSTTLASRIIKLGIKHKNLPQEKTKTL
jgi:transcriptional regulator with GAF, ATPase, and Fis domain